MKRYSIIVAVGYVACFLVTGIAGQAECRPRVGLLTLASPEEKSQLISTLVDRLRKLGYSEGENLDIDYRYAEGDVKRLDALARELIKLQPDVLLAAEASPARAFKRVTLTLPIICLTFTDALLPELATSYARPGGNVTGLANHVEGVTGKLAELAVEIVPTTTRIGFLSNPTGASMPAFARSVSAGAATRGVAMITEEASTRDELAPAFERLSSQKADVVIVPSNGLFRTHRALIAYLALAEHLPTVADQRRYVDAGLLASYGVDETESYRRAADYVDRILKGAKPAELPIEFPTEIDLVLNLRTARALRVAIPPSLLARANEVIE